MKYGQAPAYLGQHLVDVREMMFYQYLPVKLPGSHAPVMEPRLDPFKYLVGVCCCDFIGTFGLNQYIASHVYLSAKNLFQAPGKIFNRPGYHADGFMSEDVNYLWSDKCPTIFNEGPFSLSRDDSKSMKEMEEQASPDREFSYPENSLLRLNQFNIHKPEENAKPGMRAFMKLSFSKDRYDLEGNAHNHLIDYAWEMKPRKLERNIPQSETK